MSKITDKSRVLNNGLVYLVRQLRKENYRAWGIYYSDPTKFKSLIDEIEAIRQEYIAYYGDDFKIANQVIDNHRRRNRKLRQKLTPIILSLDGQFLTITFSDETLATTTFETRRLYVKRFLKEVSPSFYVANLDYGSENGREHYHAIIKGRIDYSKWYKYGIINGEVIRPYTKDVAKVSEYINKLTNHHIKASAKQSKLIYSRKTAII